jgi:hypothetical protein
MVFDEEARDDGTPRRFNESRFAFLNRSATTYFEAVRSLVEEWFSHVPLEHQVDLRARLRSDDPDSEAAFWELYLHEGSLRSGLSVEIHPSLTDTERHPDFRLSNGVDTWYLEAVSVGRAKAELGSERRLNDVYETLRKFQVVGFKVVVTCYSVGLQALATQKLRAALRSWLAELDPDEIVANYENSSAAGHDRLPRLPWLDAGWSLEFHAVPLKKEAWDRPRSALGAQGPGEAVIVDNVTGLRRVLNQKQGRYGDLDAPLVIAIQSNTEYPTKDYEVEQALYGLSIYRPLQSSSRLSELLEEGFWLNRRGWRHSETPQVISVHGLLPWTVATTQPRCWATLEPGVVLPSQPTWIARMEIGDEALPGKADSLAEHFGLQPDWPAAGDPDFSSAND